METLRAALQNAAESFGENDRRTQNWQVQLNNAEAALNGMEKELSQNNDALEKTADGFDDAEDQADDFSEEVEDAGKQSEDAGGKFEALGTVCKAAGAAIAAAFAAVSAAAIAAGKALVDMAVEGAAYADTVLTESTVTGIATETQSRITPGFFPNTDTMISWNMGPNISSYKYGVLHGNPFR